MSRELRFSCTKKSQVREIHGRVQRERQRGLLLHGHSRSGLLTTHQLKHHALASHVRCCHSAVAGAEHRYGQRIDRRHERAISLSPCCCSIACLTRSSSALPAKEIQKMCLAVTVCYEGGNPSSPCEIATDSCPTCVVFEGDLCFEKAADECNFGFDCSSYWTVSSSSSDSSLGSASAAVASFNSSAPVTNSSSTATAASNSMTSSSSSSGGGSSGTRSRHSSSSSTDAAIAIIGTAIGLVALGFCVRRIWWRRARDTYGVVQE